MDISKKFKSFVLYKFAITIILEHFEHWIMFISFFFILYWYFPCSAKSSY